MGAGQRRVFADQAEGPAVDPDAVVEGRGLAGRRHHVDRPAQQGAAEAQGVAAAIDLGVAGDQRVGDLAVAIAVGLVQRQPVLGDQQAAVVVGVAAARAADRDADVAAPLLLGEDARRIAEHVVQRQGEAVLVGFRRDDGDGAGGFREIAPRRGDDDRVLRVGAGGDDDRIDRGLGAGEGGEGHGAERAGGEKQGFHGSFEIPRAALGRRLQLSV